MDLLQTEYSLGERRWSSAGILRKCQLNDAPVMDRLKLRGVVLPGI